MRQLEVTVARGIGFVVLVHFANHLRTSYNALEFLRAKDAQVSLGTFEKSLLLSQTIGEVRNTTKQPPAIMLLNKYGLNMTLNFLCNIAGYRNVLDRIIIFAFDRHSFQVLQRVWPQVRTLYWPVRALEPKFGTGQGAYQLFQLFRANLCTYLSMRGVDHWMIQSDTYWRANFFDLLDPADHLTENQTLLFDPEGTVGLLAAMIAGGNFFVRGNRQTANFFSRVSRQLKWLYSTDNNIMGSLCAMEFSGNRCAFLPYRLISNWRWHDGPKTDLPVLLQFDGGSGSQTKMEKMQSLGAGFAVFGTNSTVTCDQQKMLNPETAIPLKSLLNHGNDRNRVQGSILFFHTICEYAYENFPFFGRFIRTILFPYYAYFIVL